jgi:hypothetical protein
MVVTGLGIGALALAALALTQQTDPVSDRIYGRVTTATGDEYTGFLRWDRNEGSWTDLLDGSKKMIPEDFQEVARLREQNGARSRERSIEFLGVRISWDDDEEGGDPGLAQSGIRFGHLASLTVIDDDAALLVLRSGEEVELSQGSTDIGESLRGLVIDDARRGEVELEWEDLDRIEFMAAPEGATPRARRLHGTLRDRWGNAYTGYVAWDLDEIYASDLLDGEEGGVDRRIPFDRIGAIERAGSASARVTLLDGEEVLLRGTNDVDSDNRGIQVSDPGLGQVQIAWDEFEDLRFHPPERSSAYQSFGVTARLAGTVLTEDGQRHQGLVRWDNDEAFGWEILDGSYRGVVFDIELGLVERIRRRSSRSAMVTLRDGRTFELSDSNDVNSGNKGIVVETPDGTVLVEWEAFREVTFERR